jgi:hypothetical protein
MIIDGLLLFSSAQNITTGTEASTNVIDLQNARDMGPGQLPLRVAAYVVTAFATTDSATLTIQLQGSTDNSTYSVYAQSRAYTAGELTAGAKLAPLDWPNVAVGALPRYLRLAYVSGALHWTPGSITAMLVLDREDRVAYPAGINIAV